MIGIKIVAWVIIFIISMSCFFISFKSDLTEQTIHKVVITNSGKVIHSYSYGNKTIILRNKH